MYSQNNRRLVLQVLLFALVGLFGAAQASAQGKPLTNADIVEMTKAGLPENTIVLAIEKGPAQFDTSPQALIQLKNNGVSTATLDAMIRAGAPATTASSNTTSVRKPDPLNPLSTTTVMTPGSSGVAMIDGDTRTAMKYSTPDARTNSMLGAFVNPLHKSRINYALNGNHAPLRTRNTSPSFEVGIVADANPTDVVAVVKLKAKSDRREIEASRGGITGISTGFRKQDLVPVTLEEVPGSPNQVYKTYRVKLVSPIPPGEYALVYGSGSFYDFGVDTAR